MNGAERAWTTKRAQAGSASSLLRVEDQAVGPRRAAFLAAQRDGKQPVEQLVAYEDRGARGAPARADTRGVGTAFRYAFGLFGVLVRAFLVLW